MKKMILFCASLLIGLTTAAALETHNFDKKRKHYKKHARFNDAEPIMFVEKDIEFLIFPDGSFDFNTHISKRNYFNNRYRNQYSNNCTEDYRRKSVSITRDHNNNIRRIGNVFLNYDRYGKIKRIGNVFMNYHRGHGYLIQVGGLRVNYNRWGQIVRTNGQVNRFNTNYLGYNSNSYNTNTKHYNNSCNIDNDFYDDDYYNDFYYKRNKKDRRRN